MKKCYNCRQEHSRKDKIFCKECEQKQKEGTLDNKPSPVLVIYDRI